MIRSTFQLSPGLGPYRERQLWASGITRWERLPRAAAVLSPRLDARIRAAVDAAAAALAAGDADALAALVPRRERWRLYPAFAEEAAFLDVETDADGLVTAVSVLDRAGPRVFLRDRDLDGFPPASAGWKLLVTYNGEAFDVPVLRRAFHGWTPPRAHVDLRHLWLRLGHQGGLKLLEAETGVGRPPHVAGLDGAGAVRLWERHRAGEPGALRRLAEYNLYDAVNLKGLLTLAYNRMIERHALPGEPIAVFERGDVLYDLTKQVLAV